MNLFPAPIYLAACCLKKPSTRPGIKASHFNSYDISGKLAALEIQRVFRGHVVRRDLPARIVALYGEIAGESSSIGIRKFGSTFKSSMFEKDAKKMKQSQSSNKSSPIMPQTTSLKSSSNTHQPKSVSSMAAQALEDLKREEERMIASIEKNRARSPNLREVSPTEFVNNDENYLNRGLNTRNNNKVKARDQKIRDTWEEQINSMIDRDENTARERENNEENERSVLSALRSDRNHDFANNNDDENHAHPSAEDLDREIELNDLVRETAGEPWSAFATTATTGNKMSS